MNAKQLIAVAAVALVSATAMAQEITPEPSTAVSIKTRDEVKAALVAARKDGSIKAWSVGYIEPTKSAKSREQVRSELDLAKASGELAAINSEAGDSSRGVPFATRVSSR